jgi:hypothetical protein
MPKRSWDELVAEGRRLVAQEDDVRWQLGDLALEVAPMGDSGVNTGVMDKLRKYAEEIGIEADTLDWYRKTSHAWPGETRVSPVTWSVYKLLAWRDDRRELIKQVKTTGDALRVLGRKLRATSQPAVAQVMQYLSDPEVARTVMADPQVRHIVDEFRPTEDKAEQARRLVRDPAVARQVVRDNTARSAMAHAAKEMEQESAQRQRERAPSLVGMSDFYQATGELSRMRQSGMKSLDAMRRVDLSDDQRDSLKDDHERVKLVSEWIDSYLESGDHSFDKELDALLREET